MATYNLLPCFDTGLTENPVYVVDFGVTIPSFGNIYSATDGFSTVCGIVTNETTDIPSFTAVTSYPSCVDCYGMNNTFPNFEDCITLEQVVFQWITPSMPQVNQVYELNPGEDIRCFKFIGLFFNPGIVNLGSYVSGPYNTCFDCNGILPTYKYEVDDCFFGTKHVIETTLIIAFGTIIKFHINDNPLNIKCGEVVSTSIDIPDSTFIQIFIGSCPECTGTTTNVRQFINCFDGSVEILLCSNLWTEGQVAFVEQGDALDFIPGCFTVGPIVEIGTPVFGVYVVYLPFTDCQECRQCNPISVIFDSCMMPGLTGSTLITQQISLNEIFYNPTFGCCYVMSETGVNDSITLGTLVYSGCPDCYDTTIIYENWYAESCNGETFVISIPIGTGFVGGVTKILFGSNDFNCVTLIEPYVEQSVQVYALTDETFYTDCPTCLDTILFAKAFYNCQTQSIFYSSYSPSTLDNLNTIIQTSEGDCIQILSKCDKYYNNTPQIYPVNSFTTCTECQTAPIVFIYKIEDCLVGGTFYLESPIFLPTNQIIKYKRNDLPFDILCGRVIALEPTPYLNATFVEIFEANCDVCVNTTYLRRFFINCLTNEIYIFNCSTLLEEGQIVSLFDTGCFSVGGVTDENPSTTTVFANYLPLADCQECLQCQSVGIIYTLCDSPEISGLTRTYQLILTGETFIHPVSGCCQVVGYTNDFYNVTSLSFYVFPDCLTCNNSISTYETWIALDCNTNVYLISVPIGFGQIGNITKVLQGLNTSFCVVFSELYTGQPLPFYYSIAISDLSTFTEGQCVDCNLSIPFGFAFYNCATQSLEFRSMYINDVYQLYYGGIGKSSDGACLQFLNGDCFYNTTPLFVPIEVFNNCVDCLNSPTTFSAGTEYFMCVPDCSGNTIAVSVPHPSWTNNQGQTIILLDAVQLGGANGLYN